ncbi:MAG: hypothetical protein WCO37_12825 [Bacteroidota bacterium]|jgi:hypothetical protein
MKNVLEHEILKTLYSFTLTVTGNGSNEKGHVPTFERTYGHCSLHFGTLVDYLNSPDKYSIEKRPKGQIGYMQSLVVRMENVDIVSRYGWYEVADAIDVLLVNEHITVSQIQVDNNDTSKNISLSDKGVIAFRQKYYLKENENEEIESIKNSISRIELNLKQHWLRNEILKYTITTIIGVILGAIIALVASKWK